MRQRINDEVKQQSFQAKSNNINLLTPADFAAIVNSYNDVSLPLSLYTSFSSLNQ